MILNKKNPNSQKSQPIKGTPLADIPNLIKVDEEYTLTNLVDKQDDEYSINTFRVATFGNKFVEYKEENLIEASETVQVVKFIEEDFDLVLCGRRHDDEWPPLKGLSDWSEIQEMGAIGDMLVSTESMRRASVRFKEPQFSKILTH